MTPNADFFNWIEDYCNDQLTLTEKQQFEDELTHNIELREEVELYKEIQSAVLEKDVMNLRDKLEEVALNKENGSFELFEDFSDIREITETVSPEDLINFYDSLPKVHVHQHEIASRENIHQFYKEQYQQVNNEDEEEFNSVDFDILDEFEDFDGLEEAVLEKDIFNLRETLAQVSKSVKSQFSVEDIDSYVSGEMDQDTLEAFEIELAQNSSLQQEVTLHQEMEDALNEADVFNLRSQLCHILETETSWNVSELNIEQYIDGELEGELLVEFMAELNENTDLMAEVALRRNINVAIAEEDISDLRNKLISARKSSESTEIKSIVPETSVSLFPKWKRGVAVAVILLGVAGIYNLGYKSLDNTYNSFYQSPSWSSERSVSSTDGVTSDELNYLNKANYYYSSGNYKKAIELYDLALKQDDEGMFVFHFYKGASLQNMEKYKEAIPEYNQVIKQGDNLYIEEAEWNKTLCYVKLGEKEKVRQNLEAIINRKSYYEKEAKILLRRLKYSIK